MIHSFLFHLASYVTEENYISGVFDLLPFFQDDLAPTIAAFVSE